MTPPQKLASLTLSPDMDHLPAFMACVSEAARGQGLGPELVAKIDLVVEEVITNICKYGAAPGPVELTCLGSAEAFLLEIADAGRPFDITALPEPDLTKDVANRPIGGLGVYFIKKAADKLEYSREGGRNVLRLTFRKVPAP